MVMSFVVNEISEILIGRLLRLASKLLAAGAFSSPHLRAFSSHFDVARIGCSLSF